MILSSHFALIFFQLGVENLFKDDENSIDHLWCIDIDECATATHLCPPNECINHVGYYECQERFYFKNDAILRREDIFDVLFRCTALM